MTTGSWTVGLNNINGVTTYAIKSWTGGDGKFEPWIGGTRTKWNSYTMHHRKVKQSAPYMGHGQGQVSDAGLLSVKSNVGWGTNDDLRLLDKLAQQVRGHSFDLGINIAESRKTYKSILDNLRSLGSALVALKHGRVSIAFRHLGINRRNISHLNARDVSGRWLEMQYAWLPLVSQAYEASKALESLSKPRVLRFSASSRLLGKYDGAITPTYYSYIVKTSYLKKLNCELVEDISTARSLGMVDPKQIVWEIVPYSFVIDWFIPVGTFLSAWAIIPKLKGRFLTIERAGQKGTVPILKAPAIAAGWKPTDRQDTAFYFSRTPSSSLSVPLPRFNNLPRALSPRRLLNAVALIHQRLR